MHARFIGFNRHNLTKPRTHCFDQNLLTFGIQKPHPPDMRRKVSAFDEFGQDRLHDDGGLVIQRAANSDDRIGQRRRHHHVSETDRREHDF